MTSAIVHGEIEGVQATKLLWRVRLVGDAREYTLRKKALREAFPRAPAPSGDTGQTHVYAMSLLDAFDHDDPCASILLSTGVRVSLTPDDDSNVHTLSSIRPPPDGQAHDEFCRRFGVWVTRAASDETVYTVPQTARHVREVAEVLHGMLAGDALMRGRDDGDGKLTLCRSAVSFVRSVFDVINIGSQLQEDWRQATALVTSSSSSTGPASSWTGRITGKQVNRVARRLSTNRVTDNRGGRVGIDQFRSNPFAAYSNTAIDDKLSSIAVQKQGRRRMHRVRRHVPSSHDRRDVCGRDGSDQALHTDAEPRDVTPSSEGSDLHRKTAGMWLHTR